MHGEGQVGVAGIGQSWIGVYGETHGRPESGSAGVWGDGLMTGDGVSFLGEIRGRGGLGSMKTIGLTAYSDPVTRERVLSAGFDEVLWKPVDGQDLLRAVKRVIAAG